MKYISTIPLRMINQISGASVHIPEESVMEILHVTEIHGYENTVVVEFVWEHNTLSIERDTFKLCFKEYNDAPKAITISESANTHNVGVDIPKIPKYVERPIETKPSETKPIGVPVVKEPTPKRQYNKTKKVKL